MGQKVDHNVEVDVSEQRHQGQLDGDVFASACVRDCRGDGRGP